VTFSSTIPPVVALRRAIVILLSIQAVRPAAELVLMIFIDAVDRALYAVRPLPE
jgi:hypothetical protein